MYKAYVMKRIKWIKNLSKFKIRFVKFVTATQIFSENDSNLLYKVLLDP